LGYSPATKFWLFELTRRTGPCAPPGFTHSIDNLPHQRAGKINLELNTNTPVGHGAVRDAGFLDWALNFNRKVVFPSTSRLKPDPVTTPFSAVLSSITQGAS
jgi:hypothetical protein